MQYSVLRCVQCVAVCRSMTNIAYGFFGMPGMFSSVSFLVFSSRRLIHIHQSNCAHTLECVCIICFGVFVETSDAYVDLMHTPVELCAYTAMCVH